MAETENTVETESATEASEQISASQEQSENSSEITGEPPTPDWSKMDALEADEQGRAEQKEDAPFPSEKVEAKAETDKEEEPETTDPKTESEELVEEEEEEELDSIVETLTDEEKKEVNLPKPARKRLRALEKLDKQVIRPFLDPETPIEDAWKAISDLHSTRASELSAKIAESSIMAYPDQWLEAIVGEKGITVESVKVALSRKGETVESGTTSAVPRESDTLSIPSLRDQPEVKLFMEELADTYGEDWQNAAKDGDLLDGDKAAVQSFRAQLAQDDARVKKEQQLTAQLKQAEERIDSLTPQVDEIKKSQATAYENEIKVAVNKATDTYREQVATRSFPKVFDDLGLKETESDTDDVKALKQLVQNKFNETDGYISDFEFYAEHNFSDKENFGKVIRRVAKNLGDATQKEIDASRNPDSALSQKLTREATQLRQLAMDEQDTVTVLTNRAAKEFLGKQYQPILNVLQENADLKRGAQRNTRDETIGTGAAIKGNESWKDRISKDNPFEGDPLGDRLSALG